LDPNFIGERRIPGRGRLGMVFQEPRLLPWRTVADNLRLVLSPDESLDELDGLIDTLGLGAHLSHYPGELSLGLARRVAIARAFAARPD
ncbi:ATP-binding cassette domain-containing protein, partial [Acinetobacter baumannii]